jgi:A nuclease family of the HNH/ENDO VII superfamily with conserved AHH
LANPAGPANSAQPANITSLAPSTTWQTAFDDDGYLNPGIVDALAPQAQQAAQLAAYLQRQGMSAEQAKLTAQQALDNPIEGVPHLPSPLVVIELPPQIISAWRDPVRAAFNEALHSAAAAGAVLTGDALLELGSKLWGRALSGLTGLTELVALAPELSLKAAGTALTLLTMPGNAGDRTLRVELSEALRFEQAPGEVGRLLELTADGNWQVIKTGVSLGMLGNQRVALTGDEIKALTAPLTNPSDPRPNPPLFTPMPSSDERLGELPGFEGAAPAGPTTSTTPVETQSWQDLLIDKSNADKLAENLEKAGQPKPATGYQPHHMVPSKDGGSAMQAIRDKLALLDLDLNDAANGVWLPGSRSVEKPGEPAYHPRLANDRYNEAMIKLLNPVTTKQEAIRVLAEVAAMLQSREFPGVRPRPPKNGDEP